MDEDVQDTQDTQKGVWGRGAVYIDTGSMISYLRGIQCMYLTYTFCIYSTAQPAPI